MFRTEPWYSTFTFRASADGHSMLCPYKRACYHDPPGAKSHYGPSACHHFKMFRNKLVLRWTGVLD